MAKSWPELPELPGPLDDLPRGDYNGHMVKTLRESKAKLSEMVERAGRGEDVLITVRGKVKARLTRASAPDPAFDRKAWIRELQKLQKAYCVRRPTTTVEAIVAEIREDII